MMKKTFRTSVMILGLCLGLTGCHQVKQENLVCTGVSWELATRRKAIIKDLQYQLWFRIPEVKTEQVEGQVEVLFRMDQPEQVVLDFREDSSKVKQVVVNGQDVEVKVVNEHILIPQQYLRTGENKVNIEFVAGDQSLNRNDDYLYTLLVPDRARTLFPCFDQPDLKAVYTLELDIPEDWVAVANGPLVKESVGEHRKQLSFKTTQPLSTYLFSFVAGKWKQVQETQDGRTVALYYRETDPNKCSQIKVIFDQVFAALKWMEEYTGIPYPFEKYDLIIVPGFQFGGMEHAGAVLYNDKRMFLNEHPTLEEELGRMELISHETAHMWFGDDVTMAWFNDVWTKEVFANYFAARMTEPQFPQINHRLNTLRSFFPPAYSEDRTGGTNAIRQPLDNLNNAGLIYGQIVYNKAPIVMSMLVDLLGEENFRKGIQEYLRTYAYSNATWDGLISILDRYTSENLTAWSRVWVDEKGMPEISATWQKGQLVVKERDRFDRHLTWPQQLDYLLVRKPMDGRSCFDMETVTINMSDTIGTKAVPEGVEYIIPNISGKGYGYFAMDSATLDFCLDHLTIFTDPVARLSVIISLNENLLNHRIPVDRFTETMLRHLKEESESLITTAIISYVRQAYPSLQMGQHTATERALWELVSTKGHAGVQQTAFRALLDIWTLPEITQEMRQLWTKQKNISGLVIGERDEMKMAYELAIRLPEQYLEIIEKQVVRITNPDRNQEFRFIAQGLIADSTVRDSLFNTLLLAENRRIEPSVGQLMYYLNHPLRDLQSVKYIRPALEHLQEVQRTGDIFFPKNWLSATLRGHNSLEATKAVNQFLNEYPDYPPLLKNKILQSADHLFRNNQ